MLVQGTYQNGRDQKHCKLHWRDLDSNESANFEMNSAIKCIWEVSDMPCLDCTAMSDYQKLKTAVSSRGYLYSERGAFFIREKHFPNEMKLLSRMAREVLSECIVDVVERGAFIDASALFMNLRCSKAGPEFFIFWDRSNVTRPELYVYNFGHTPINMYGHGGNGLAVKPAIKPGSSMTMVGFGKACFEKGLRQIGVKMPWYRKHCFHCKKALLQCAELRWCSRCKAVMYCSKKCQKKSWSKGHRVQCSRVPPYNDL